MKKWIYFDNAATSIREKIFYDYYASLFKEKITYSESIILETLKKLSSKLSTEPSKLSLVNNSSCAINHIIDTLQDKVTIFYVNKSEHLSTINTIKKTNKKIIFFQIKDIEKILNLINEEDALVISSNTNLLGDEIDLKKLKIKGRLIIDASQTIAHKYISLKENNHIDFLYFNPHKSYGPNGIGVIYSKNNEIQIQYQNKNLDLRALLAWQRSLDLICEYKIAFKEKKLINYIRNHLPKETKYIKWFNYDIFSTIILLETKEIGAHDFAYYLEKNNIIVRTGLCCSFSPEYQNIQFKFVRISISYKNTKDEIDYLIKLINEFDKSMCF